MENSVHESKEFPGLKGMDAAALTMGEARIRECIATSGKVLDLSGLKLVSLPEMLGNLSQLETLNLSKNELKDLPESLLESATHQALKLVFLHQNDDLGIPAKTLGPAWFDIIAVPEAERKSAREILTYYFETWRGKGRPLREIKVIVLGRQGSGKSSVCDALQGKPFQEEREPDDGVTITPWHTNIKGGTRGNSATVQLWDFGGPQGMQGADRFFMSHRSLYIVVVADRDNLGEKNAEEWVKQIREFTPDAPIFIALNKQDKEPFEIRDKNHFSERYGIPKNHIFKTNCSLEVNTGIKGLRKKLLAKTSELLATIELFPKSWWDVKEHLSEMRREFRRDCLSFEEFNELCHEKKVPQEQRADLLRALRDTGVIVTMMDGRLSDLLVLNPQWVRHALYLVFSNPMLQERQDGHLTMEDLKAILPKGEWNSDGRRRYLLQLMEEYDLCFPLDGQPDTVLVPELLPDRSPSLLGWKAEDCTLFSYEYNILPKSILPKFITRTRNYSHGPDRWRSGVILKKESETALVLADFSDKKLTIWLKGNSPRPCLLNLLREHLEVIHVREGNLNQTARIGVRGYPDVMVPVAALIQDEEEGKTTYRVRLRGKQVDYPIAALLKGIDIMRDHLQLARQLDMDSSTEPGTNTNATFTTIYETNYVQHISGGNFFAPVGIHQMLEQCYNTVQHSPEHRPGSQTSLGKLLGSIDALKQNLDSTVERDVSEALETLIRELIKEEPKGQWVQVSVDTLRTSLQSLGTASEPAIAALDEVLQTQRAG